MSPRCGILPSPQLLMINFGQGVWKMFTLAVLAGIASALAKGGRLKNLSRLEIRQGWLLLVVLLCRTAVDHGGQWGFTWFSAASPWLMITGYTLLLGISVANRHLPGVKALGLGTALNLVAIASNGGRMPVAETAVQAIGGERVLQSLASGRDLAHTLMTNETAFPFLADVLYLPPPWPLPEVFSIGDVLIAIGITLFLHHSCCRTPRTLST